MAYLEIDWVDIKNNYNELREWMDNHGLADHVLEGNLETLVVKKDDLIVAVVQEQPATIVSMAIDKEANKMTTYKIGQVIKAAFQYKGQTSLLIVQPDSPSHDGAKKLFRPISYPEGIFII